MNETDAFNDILPHVLFFEDADQIKQDHQTSPYSWEAKRNPQTTASEKMFNNHHGKQISSHMQQHNFGSYKLYTVGS